MIKKIIFISGFLVFCFFGIFYQVADVSNMSEIYENAEKYLFEKMQKKNIEHQEVIVNKKIVRKINYLTKKSFFSFLEVCFFFFLLISVIIAIVRCF